MSLASEYQQQFPWRAWSQALDQLPPLEGRTVLDLGCGAGDLSAELAARGAWVTGVDLQEELLAEARSRGLAGARFLAADLRALPALESAADGIWCSFAAAYFPDLVPVLEHWKRRLKVGGWIALVEIDDLFGHRPLPGPTADLLSAYARASLAAGRYDFHMGGKLRRHLEGAGFQVERELELPDRELSFNGAAAPEVILAWRRRLGRMRLLKEHCGPAFPRVEEDLLNCLGRADHIAVARVCYLVARAREGAELPPTCGGPA